MQHFLRGIFLACILVQFAAGSTPFASPTPSHQAGLANLLFNSNDPQVAFACFGDYIANLNTTGVVYKQNYTKCLQEAEEGRYGAEKYMYENKLSLAQTAKDICGGWERCQTKNATLDVFLCHAKEGPSSAMKAYSLADRAEEFAKTLSGRYREIESNKESCCKSAERKYAADGADLYQQLKVCLKGKKRPVFPRIENAATAANEANEANEPKASNAPSDLDAILPL